MNDQQSATKKEPTEADARAFVENIHKACGKGKRFVFRGINENFSTKQVFKEGGKIAFTGEEVDREKISSGLYWFYKDKRVFNESYHPVHIEKEVVEKARRLFPANATNIEILTELQHFKGKTTLIDFSSNLAVALFFACSGEVKSNGEVILLSGVEEKKEVSYENLGKGGKDLAMHLIAPSQVQSSRDRVKGQHSVFLHAPKGYVEAGELTVFVVKKELKPALLAYLKRFYDLHADTIYNDIFGFIKNEKNYETAALRFYQGNAKFDLKDYAEAIAEYDRAIALDPKSGAAYVNRGNAKALLGRHEEAIADFDRALALDSKLALAYDNRGNAKGRLGRNEEALADFDKAIELDPDYKKAYFNRGNARKSLKDYEGAIADYNKAIELDPEDKLAYVNRGGVKGSLGRHKEALADFDKAIELDPEDKEAYNNRGNAKGRLGRNEEAIADYNKAIELDPQFKEAYLNRGIVKTDLKDYEGALADCNKAIELDPDYEEAYNSRGRVKAELGLYSEAVANFKVALRLDPELKQARNNLQLAIEAGGDPAAELGAEEEILPTSKSKLKSKEAYYRRGLKNHELGDYKKAIADFSQAIALDPEYQAAYHKRGVSKDANNSRDFEGVIADFNKAIELDPEAAEVYFDRGYAKQGLGKAYEDAEKKLQAKQHYQAALSDFEKAEQLNFHAPALAAVKEEIKKDLARLAAELDEGAAGS